MIEASISGLTNLFSSAGFGPILFIAIVFILLSEVVIVLSAVIATVGLNQQRDRIRRR